MSLYRIICFLLVFLSYLPFTQAQLRLASWNLKNFGASKTSEQMQLISSILKDFDIVALQEITTAPNGAQQVARLVALLQQTGEHWDYVLSPPTRSGNKGEQERYAFLWKTSLVKISGKAQLEPHFRDSISREPFMADFIFGQQRFTLVNFHALPKKKQPEREIKWFKFLPRLYPNKQLIFLGDFNCTEQHSVFNPLKKMGYHPALQGQKTTLRQKCIQNDCLASAYDNIFFPAGLKLQKSGVVPFFHWFHSDMKAARSLSDHLPVYAIFD